MSSAPEDLPPRELVVDARAAPGDASSGSGTAMAPFVLTVFAAGGLAKLVSPTAGLVGLGVSIVALLLLRRPNQGRFVLRVADDVLEVTRERPTSAPTRIALVDLLSVTLDRQQQAGGRGGATMERVQLSLERRAPEEPIVMPEDRITPLEAQEWQAKVRVFLRKHGWLPADERRES